MQRSELSRWLAAEQAKLVDELATKLRDGSDSDALTALRSRLSLIEETRARFDDSWQRRLRLVCVVAFAVVLTLTVLAVLKMPGAFVSLDVVARAASIVTGADGMVLHDIAVGESAQIRGAASVSSPLLDGSASDREQDAQFRATTLVLSELFVPRNSRLDVARQATEISLFAQPSDAEAVATFELAGAFHATLRPSANEGAISLDQTVDVPETFVLSSAKAVASRGTARPMEIVMDPPAGSTEIHDVYPVALAFVERSDATGGRPFVGSVVSGSLSVPEIDRTQHLHADDTLSVVGLDASRVRIRIGEQIHVELSGYANDIRLKSGSVARSLVPSLLEFAAKSHTLTFLWAAAGFLWGLIWAARKVLGL